MRLFVSLHVPDPVRLHLAEGFRELERLAGDQVRWTPPANLHLTLRFLGEIEEGPAREIERSLKLISLATFRLRTNKLAVLPSRSKPKVIVSGVEENLPLRELQRSVAAACDRVTKAPSGDRFVPHITVGRFREWSPQLLSEMKSTVVPPVDWDATYFELVESRLGTPHATYVSLSRFDLLETI